MKHDDDDDDPMFFVWIQLNVIFISDQMFFFQSLQTNSTLVCLVCVCVGVTKSVSERWFVIDIDLPFLKFISKCCYRSDYSSSSASLWIFIWILIFMFFFCFCFMFWSCVNIFYEMKIETKKFLWNNLYIIIVQSLWSWVIACLCWFFLMWIYLWVSECVGFLMEASLFEGKNGINFNFSKNSNLTNCYRQKKWSTADCLSP